MIRIRTSILVIALLALMVIVYADNNGPRLSPGDTGGHRVAAAVAVDAAIVAQTGDGSDTDLVATDDHPRLSSGRFGPTLTR